MTVIQFKVGHPKHALTVTIQEEDAETAVEEYETFLKTMSEDDAPPTGTPWFNPPVIN